MDVEHFQILGIITNHQHAIWHRDRILDISYSRLRMDGDELSLLGLEDTGGRISKEW